MTLFHVSAHAARTGYGGLITPPTAVEDAKDPGINIDALAQLWSKAHHHCQNLRNLTEDTELERLVAAMAYGKHSTLHSVQSKEMTTHAKSSTASVHMDNTELLFTTTRNRDDDLLNHCSNDAKTTDESTRIQSTAAHLWCFTGLNAHCANLIITQLRRHLKLHQRQQVLQNSDKNNNCITLAMFLQVLCNDTVSNALVRRAHHLMRRRRTTPATQNMLDFYREVRVVFFNDVIRALEEPEFQSHTVDNPLGISSFDPTLSFQQQTSWWEQIVAKSSITSSLSNANSIGDDVDRIVQELDAHENQRAHTRKVLRILNIFEGGKAQLFIACFVQFMSAKQVQAADKSQFNENNHNNSDELLHDNVSTKMSTQGAQIVPNPETLQEIQSCVQLQQEQCIRAPESSIIQNNITPTPLYAELPPFSYFANPWF